MIADLEAEDAAAPFLATPLFDLVSGSLWPPELGARPAPVPAAPENAWAV